MSHTPLHSPSCLSGQHFITVLLPASALTKTSRSTLRGYCSIRSGLRVSISNAVVPLIPFSCEHTELQPKTTERDERNLTSEHAGFLMALGLNGHLNSLARLSLHDYLVKVGGARGGTHTF